MNKQYVMTVNKKDAQELHDKMFDKSKVEGKFLKLPRKGKEHLRALSCIELEFGGIQYGITNEGEGLFNLYQYQKVSACKRIQNQELNA